MCYLLLLMTERDSKKFHAIDFALMGRIEKPLASGQNLPLTLNGWSGSDRQTMSRHELAVILMSQALKLPPLNPPMPL